MIKSKVSYDGREEAQGFIIKTKEVLPNQRENPTKIFPVTQPEQYKGVQSLNDSGFQEEAINEKSVKNQISTKNSKQRKLMGPKSALNKRLATEGKKFIDEESNKESSNNVRQSMGPISTQNKRLEDSDKKNSTIVRKLIGPKSARNKISTSEEASDTDEESDIENSTNVTKSFCINMIIFFLSMNCDV